MESDWKKYSAKVDAWRDRYLAGRNARIIRMLTDSKKSETERFWDALAAMEKEAKTLRQCLDPHSRSKMWMHLVMMRNVGMITKEDLAEFSEELQKQVFEDPFGTRG
jgi:hypothetical protein